MTTDAQTLVGVIENIEIKDGKKKDGNPWRLHKFKIRSPAGTRSYSTFDKGWPTNLLGGETYRFTFTEEADGEYTNRTLTGAVLVDPGEFGTQPADVGEFQEPYEPPSDEAKERVDTAPKAEYKSPSRSYDQNQDIQRRSIERQGALKAAVELFRDTFAAATVEESTALLLQCADDLFAWLQDTFIEPPERPTEPVSEPQGTEQQARVAGERGGKTQASHEALHGEPLFPPEPFADIGQFRSALKDNYDLATTAQVNKALDEAGLGPLAELGNLDEAYANLAAHRGEPVESTEA